MKILIVDDSNLMRKTIGKAVSAEGFETLLACNGSEALDLLYQNKSDVGLVLLDWNMPVMDGYDALVAIRSDEQLAKIPVMMATSAGLEDDLMRAVKAGANDYMVKPFKMSELTKKIHKLVSKVDA